MTGQQKRVLIIGGGFGGIATALAFEKHRQKNLHITLVSNKPHFEYHAALYRIVAGGSPLEVCVPLRDIFEKLRFDWTIDTITQINFESKTALGNTGSKYSFDFLVLALGSVTEYFGIAGLPQFSFGYKSISESLSLKNHIHEMFEKAKLAKSKEEKARLLRFTIIGAGASGVELAGELALYAKKLSLKHETDKNLVSVNLFEVAPRILPNLPAKISAIVDRRLHLLGVNIFTQQKIIREDLDQLTVEGNIVKTNTVIWTAGVKPNELYSSIKEFQLNPKGKVLVDEYLQASGNKNIFIIGDGAATPYTGMAQTAVYDGKFAANAIVSLSQGLPLSPYKPKQTYSAIPVGSGWAVALIGKFTFCGYKGWLIRRAADLKYLLTILPFLKALTAWRSGGVLCESCETCDPKKVYAKN